MGVMLLVFLNTIKWQVYPLNKKINHASEALLVFSLKFFCYWKKKRFWCMENACTFYMWCLLMEKKIWCFWMRCCILKIRCMEGACIFNVWKAPAHLMWWLLMKKKNSVFECIVAAEWWYENSLRTIKLILKNKI